MSGEKKPGPVTVFYSYAHKDERFVQQLSNSLAPLKWQGLVKEWYDGHLIPGENWEAEIFAQLDAAEVIVLLVSPDFIASYFIWGKEVARALARDAAGQACVIPVIIRPADWQSTPIKLLQALPKHGKPLTEWDNRDAGWLDVAKGIRKAIEKLQTSTRSGSAPSPVPAAPPEASTTVSPVAKKVQPRSRRAMKPGTRLQRTIYTANNAQTLPGAIARREGDPATGDVAVDEAYDHLGLAYDFFWNIFSRDSIDGKGMPLEAVVHYSRSFDNGFWNGQQIILGDGDGRIFNRFTISPEILAQEYAKGILEAEPRLVYWHQSGALLQSLAFVLGTMVKQYGLKQTVDQADWLIGDRLLASGIKGKALFSLAEPGTAYDDPILGKDTQPAHMRNYVRTHEDNGGIHINAGIPGHAFYLAAMALGGCSWERAGKIWYATILDKRLLPTAQFKDFARLSYDNAVRLNGAQSRDAQAVLEAWEKVGIKLAKS